MCWYRGGHWKSLQFSSAESDLPIWIRIRIEKLPIGNTVYHSRYLLSLEFSCLHDKRKRPPCPLPLSPRWQVEIIWTSKMPTPTGIANPYQTYVKQRSWADVISPYKRKCRTNSVGPLDQSLLWVMAGGKNQRRSYYGCRGKILLS